MKETQSRTHFPMGAVLDLPLCSWDPVSRLYMGEVDDSSFIQKDLFFLSPYAKVFSGKLEHGISIRTCPLHVEIPNHNLFYVQGAGKIFGSNRDPLLERGMAKLTC